MEYNDKQLQILETAEKLFSNRGYDGTSVRDIADEAGVNIAMISYYFGSKEKLMQAIFEKRTQQLSEKIEFLLYNDELTPFEKINILIDDYISRIVSKERFYKLMICEQMLDKNTVVKDLLQSLKQRNNELIAKLVLDGVAKGAFKSGVDTMFLMNTLIGTTMQAYINREYYRNSNNLHHLTEEDFKTMFVEKLTKYIKQLFKAILSYEG